MISPSTHQVYQPDMDEYITINKLEGRKFRDEEFARTLKRFFYNGLYYRTELLGPFIERLETLLYNVEKADCYRFYCSSLLLMYDGDTGDDDDCGDNDHCHVEVRMIDFAQCVLKEEVQNSHRGPDRGYIKGLRNVIDILKNLKNGSLENST